MRKKRIEDRGRRIARTGQSSSRALAILYLLSIFLLTAPTGCNVLGVLVYKTRGPAPIPAEYVPKREPMLVMAENWNNPALSRLDAEELARHVTAELQQYDIVPAVEQSELEAVRTRPNFASMKLSEIGQAAGASQVLYVNILKFNVQDTIGSEMIKGQVDATVKVIDAATGKTLWPSDEPEGKLLSLETPQLRTGAGIGPTGGGPNATETAMRDTMCREMAVRIVKLFRKWSPDFDDGGASQNK
jgi:hypothetical protein